MHFPTAVTVLTLLPGILAAPINPRSNVNPGAQSCKARSRGLVVNYTTHIGVPFSQSKCDAAVHAINSKAGLPSSIRCYDGGDDTTTIKFNNIPGGGELINEALGGVFGFGFNCPDW